jgi:hypothetical protein
MEGYADVPDSGGNSVEIWPPVVRYQRERNGEIVETKVL